MSTILSNPSEMIRQGAPHLIHSDEELEAYTEALFTLTDKADQTSEDRDAIDLLTLLIDQYEARQYPVPDVQPLDILRFLVEHQRLTEADLLEELGDQFKAVLTGDMQLTRDQIASLSARFRVAPSVFFPAR